MRVGEGAVVRDNQEGGKDGDFQAHTRQAFLF